MSPPIATSSIVLFPAPCVHVVDSFATSRTVARALFLADLVDLLERPPDIRHCREVAVRHSRKRDMPVPMMDASRSRRRALMEVRGGRELSRGQSDLDNTEAQTTCALPLLPPTRLVSYMGNDRGALPPPQAPDSNKGCAPEGAGPTG